MAAARRRPIPEWAHDPQLKLGTETVEKYNHTEFSQHQRGYFNGIALHADVVLPGEADIHYQLRRPTWPEDMGTWPKDFSTLLSEVVEEHFGSVDDFRVEYVRELRQWGLLAKGVRTRPLFNSAHYYENFLMLLDRVLAAVES